MLLRLVLLTLAITVIQVTAIKQPRSIPKYTEWRLPRWVLPRHYKLRLLPFIEEGNFTTAGQVDILLECMEPTQMIVLHIADIRIVQDEGLQVNKSGDFPFLYKHDFLENQYSDRFTIWLNPDECLSSPTSKIRLDNCWLLGPKTRRCKWVNITSFQSGSSVNSTTNSTASTGHRTRRMESKSNTNFPALLNN